MATRSSVAMDKGTTLTISQLAELLEPFDPLLDENSWLHSNFPMRLDFTYVSRRLESVYLKQRAVSLADTLLDLRDPEGLVMIGLGQARENQVQESQRNLLLAIAADPDSHHARYALLRPWFSRIARGENPPQRIREELAAIRGTAAVTVRAWLAAAAGNWEEVDALDEALATTLPTDLWYLDTVKLRVDRRIKTTTPGSQPALAREATKLIDEAIALYQDPDFYAMRLAAAFVADDAAEIIETARRLIYIFEYEATLAESGQVKLDVRSLRAKLQQVAAVQQVLSNFAEDDRIPSYKVEQLKAATESISDRLLATAQNQ